MASDIEFGKFSLEPLPPNSLHIIPLFESSPNMLKTRIKCQFHRVSTSNIHIPHCIQVTACCFLIALAYSQSRRVESRPLSFFDPHCVCSLFLRKGVQPPSPANFYSDLAGGNGAFRQFLQKSFGSSNTRYIRVLS